MNETIRAHQTDLAAIVALSNRVFRRPGQTSMSVAFSKLFSDGNAHNLLIVKEDETPVSLMGLLPTTLHVAGCRIPIASMGSVCTDPEYRGRQFASNLMHHALQHLHDEGAAILLVSGDRSLYTRHHCMNVGQVQCFRITDEIHRKIAAADIHCNDAQTRVEISPWQPNDLPNMLAIMQKEPAYFERSIEDFAELIQGASLFSCYPAEQHVRVRKVNGTLDAYVVFGTLQRDNQAVGEAIEFGGDVNGVITLLQAAMQEFRLSQVELMVPNYHRTMSEKLASLGCSFRSTTIPGTIRIVNLPKLWKLLQPYFANELGADVAEQLQCVPIGHAGANVATSVPEDSATASNAFLITYAGESLTIDLRGATTLLFNGPSVVGYTPLKRVLGKLFPIPFVSPNNLNYV